MQEIKARAKAFTFPEEDKINEWITGYLVGKNWIVGDIVDWSTDYIHPSYWRNIIPDTLGFFTGEQDSKGVDLWSGDIVEDSDVRYEIRFGKWEKDLYDDDVAVNGGIGFYLVPINKDPRFFMGTFTPQDGKVFTKIGDIHNNPELLNK